MIAIGMCECLLQICNLQALKNIPHYTYEDYCRWEGQWELIDGIPYAMSPAPRPEHQAIATNLASEFRIALKKTDVNVKFTNLSTIKFPKKLF